MAEKESCDGCIYWRGPKRNNPVRRDAEYFCHWALDNAPFVRTSDPECRGLQPGRRCKYYRTKEEEVIMLGKKIDDTKALELYNSGMHDYAMADCLGVTHGTISAWRKRHGLGPNVTNGRKPVLHTTACLQKPTPQPPERVSPPADIQNPARSVGQGQRAQPHDPQAEQEDTPLRQRISDLVEDLDHMLKTTDLLVEHLQEAIRLIEKLTPKQKL